jgi:Type IV secretion-system coupling protein DNA-binding domain
MSQREETEGIMMLGDPGTGKRQTIHHFLLQIAARQPAEAVVIFDPACEFVERHYNRLRGDVILNPLDRRSPYWQKKIVIDPQRPLCLATTRLRFLHSVTRTQPVGNLS